ncbi:hypothetical protein NL676_038522 [Syzygium grande]|nr:hypothetical protein NL676_038522 [Syzygium grande]
MKVTDLDSFQDLVAEDLALDFTEGSLAWADTRLTTAQEGGEQTAKVAVTRLTVVDGDNKGSLRAVVAYDESGQ